MNGFPYLSMALKESLRLHPVAPILSRGAEWDGKVGDFFIPQGVSCHCHNYTPLTSSQQTQLSVNMYAVHRNPDIYPNPSFYDPERFSEYNIGKIPNYAYLPFGIGPRDCMGYDFGWAMTKLFVIKLLKRSLSATNQVDF
jgi:cytochrome P450